MNTNFVGLALVATALLASAPVAAADASRFDGAYGGVFMGLGSIAYEGYVDGSEIDEQESEYAEIFSGDFTSGLVGGGYAGLNVANSGFVYGLELGFTVGAIEALAPDEDATDYATQSLASLVTLTGRAGFAVTEDTLLYGAAGAGLLTTNFHAYNDTDDIDTDDGSELYTLPGLVVAAGIEQVVSDNMLLRLEASYFKPTGDHVFGDDDLHHDMDDGDYGTSTGVFRLNAGLTFQF